MAKNTTKQNALDMFSSVKKVDLPKPGRAADPEEAPVPEVKEDKASEKKDAEKPAAKKSDTKKSQTPARKPKSRPASAKEVPDVKEVPVMPEPVVTESARPGYTGGRPKIMDKRHQVTISISEELYQKIYRESFNNVSPYIRGILEDYFKEK